MAQCISHWISDFIKFSYDLAKVSPPLRITTHSSRVYFSSSVFLSSMPMVIICKAAMRLSVHTSFRHYAITQVSQADVNFSKSVMQSLFQSPITSKKVLVSHLQRNVYMHNHLKECGRGRFIAITQRRKNDLLTYIVTVVQYVLCIYPFHDPPIFSATLDIH